MERSLSPSPCSALQNSGVSQGERERKEEKGCEAERVEDEKRRRSRRRSRERRSRPIPFKLIPRPAGLHPVTLSRSSSPSAIPIQGAHLRRSAFPPRPPFFPLSKGRYFHPRVFHSSSMAIPFSFTYLPHCHNHSATVGFSKQPELTGVFFLVGFFKQKNWDSSRLSRHLFPSLALSEPAISTRIPPVTSPIPAVTFLFFHFLLMTPLPPPVSHLLLSSASFLHSSPIFVLPPCHMFSFALCRRLECHLMRPGLRAVEYQCCAAVYPGEGVKERDRPPSH